MPISRAQVVPGQVGDVDAVEGDPAAVELVEPHDQVDQRGLAGAGRADDGHGLARLDDEVEVLDERVVRRVGERHVLELDAPVRVVQLVRGAAVVGLLLGGVEHLEHPLGGGDPGLEQVRHRRDLGQRLGELARVLDERLHVAQAHRAAGHPQAADDGDDDVVEVPDEHHRRHDDAADELRAEARVVQVVVLGGERRLDLVLAAEDLDQLVAGVGLLDDRVELAGALPLLDEVLLRALADRRRDDHRDRDRHQRDQRQQRGDARASSRPSRRR